VPGEFGAFGAQPLLKRGDERRAPYATLGEHRRQYEETFPALTASRTDQVSLECRNSRVPIELIGLMKGKDVLVGCIDVASNAVETPEDVAATIRAALPYVR
jgi:5-methyltetrahydropteroyltriglutamate--homocysteine methyltransferase